MNRLKKLNYFSLDRFNILAGFKSGMTVIIVR